MFPPPAEVRSVGSVGAMVAFGSSEGGKSSFLVDLSRGSAYVRWHSAELEDERNGSPILVESVGKMRQIGVTSYSN